MRVVKGPHDLQRALVTAKRDAYRLDTAWRRAAEGARARFEVGVRTEWYVGRLPGRELTSGPEKDRHGYRERGRD